MTTQAEAMIEIERLVGALAHVAGLTPASGHGPFWMRWREAMDEAPAPELEPAHEAFRSRCGCDGVTHYLRSLGEVRVGARLIEPAGAARGGVITLHGYGAAGDLDDATPWRERGLATLKLRVRGYPGSQVDTGDLTARDEGYITLGLENAESWVMRGAVSDVFNAVRALRTRLGPGAPISLHGESFGGGLAVIAAALLADVAPVFRLAIGLPSLGAWTWRMREGNPEACGVGLGAEAARWVEAREATRETTVRTLRLFDAAIHARTVLCPTVCKLALRDEVVPPAAAAAVFNGLATSPGEKWRRLVSVGHGDGGMADLRAHASFDRLIGAFLDPEEHPARVMATP